MAVSPGVVQTYTNTGSPHTFELGAAGEAGFGGSWIVHALSADWTGCQIEVLARGLETTVPAALTAADNLPYEYQQNGTADMIDPAVPITENSINFIRAEGLMTSLKVTVAAAKTVRLIANPRTA